MRVSIGDGVALYCQDLGRGPTVVLIHGGCMSHRVWELQVESLLDAGYRVVTPDLRGHGDSDKPVSPYTAEMHARDVVALVDALEVDEFSLVGWSLGATVSATVAATAGDRLRDLALVSSNIFRSLASDRSESADDDLPIAKMVANQRRNRPRGMERFVSGMFGPDPGERTVQWLWSIGMETPMRVAVKTLEIYADPPRAELRRALSELDAAGVVFQGAHDRSASLDEAETVATEILADGAFVPFEDSGHVPFLEETDRFNDRLLGFLEQ